MWRSVKVLWRGWLIFFHAHWIFYWHWKKILVSNFSQVTIFTQIVHVYDPRHLEWARLSESLSSRLLGLFILNILVFSNLRFFLKYWSGSILYIGRLCLASDKTLYVCFHVPGRWFRNEEMRSAAEGRLKEYNKLTMHTKWEGKQTLSLILGYK